MRVFVRAEQGTEITWADRQASRLCRQDPAGEGEIPQDSMQHLSILSVRVNMARI
jgi:hypothetical protein